MKLEGYPHLGWVMALVVASATGCAGETSDGLEGAGDATVGLDVPNAEDVGASADAGAPADAGTPVDAGDPADGGSSGGARDAMASRDTGALPVVFGGDRPVELEVPSVYDPARPTPLVLLLHGYYFDPTYVAPMLRMQAFAESAGVLMLEPQGLVDSGGNHYWNAAPACCDYWGSGVDDVAYLASLIEEVGSVYNVDPDRTFVVGHSNGSFMANRLACERADLVAAIISVAGGAAPASCVPSEPVSVLHVHGELDRTIRFEGGMIGSASYPGAEATVSRWASHNGCGPGFDDGAPVDFNATTPGAETTVRRAAGCPAGIDVELWAEQGGLHIPTVPAGFAAVWSAWLAAHPKPR